MKPLDVVYIVRKGESNPELRYSLRSLVNLPHGRVWFVGHRPAWVSGVEHIPGNRYRPGWLNVFDNLRLACEHVTARRFVVMNDDFFILRPVSRIPSWHRGSLAEQFRTARTPWWRQSLGVTLQVLNELGIPEPLSYELHVPVVMWRTKLEQALSLWQIDRRRPMPPQWRTLYGNLWRVRSTPASDVKLRDRRQLWSPESAFLSTEDHTFRTVQPYLAELFPQPSPYEYAEAVAA